MTERLDERWLPCPGYESIYEVSDHGRVRRLPDGRYALTHRVMKQFQHNGYSGIRLSKESKKTSRSVHRLVAVAFLENPSRRRCVNHKNGVRSDNRLLNLEWVTHKENFEHSINVLGNTHLFGKGEANLKAKMTAETAELIRQQYDKGVPVEAIATRFSCPVRAVYRIGHRDRWSDTSTKPRKQQGQQVRSPRGFTWHKKCQKWQAATSINGKCHYFGLFDTPEKAREAYLNGVAALGKTR